MSGVQIADFSDGTWLVVFREFQTVSMPTSYLQPYD